MASPPPTTAQDSQPSTAAPGDWLQTSASQTLDLSAHSLLTAELLSEDSDKDRLWTEWAQTPGHDTPLTGPIADALPAGPLLRLKMVRILQLLKVLAKEQDESGLDQGATFVLRKSIAVAYQSILDLLLGKFGEDKYVYSSLYVSILVELKSQFIVAEMYAGIQEDTVFRNYRKGEGKALIKAVFDPSTLPDVPASLAPKVRAIFEEREAQILSLLNQGKMTFDEYSLTDLENKLRLFLSRVFKDLSAHQLPDMHPDFQEVSITKTPRQGPSGQVVEADSITSQLGRDQMAQLLNAVELVTQRAQNGAQAVLKNMGDQGSRYARYDGLPGIVDEFESPFDSMSSSVLSTGVVRRREDEAYPAYETDAWHDTKRARTDDDSYVPPSNLHIVLDPKNPLSPFQSGRTTPRRRPPGTKVPWTQEETDALEQGMNIFGNDWKAIKDHFRDILIRRTNVNLKDRARNIKRRLLKIGSPLGIWQNACN